MQYLFWDWLRERDALFRFIVILMYICFSGYWLFHCHIEFHAEIGMALIFKVGEDEEMPPVPRNFPKCGDWKLTDDQNVEGNSETSTISTIIGREESKVDDRLSNTLERLLRYMAYLEQLLKLRMTSSASNSSVTLLLFVACLLSSVIHARSLWHIYLCK